MGGRAMLDIRNDFEAAAETIQKAAAERMAEGREPGRTWTLAATSSEALLAAHPDKAEYFAIRQGPDAIGAFILTKKKTNAAWKPGPGFRYVAKLCLLAEHRGRGHADKILGWAKAAAPYGLRLEVRAKAQEGLRRLYRRNGFDEKGRAKDMVLLEWRRNGADS